jgi:hypothetical protein
MIDNLFLKIQYSILDGHVKSRIFSIFVIPAKAGIQLFQVVLDSCFRRRDVFSDFLRFHQYSILPLFLLLFHLWS